MSREKKSGILVNARGRGRSFATPGTVPANGRSVPLSSLLGRHACARCGVPQPPCSPSPCHAVLGCSTDTGGHPKAVCIPISPGPLGDTNSLQPLRRRKAGPTTSTVEGGDDSHLPCGPGMSNEGLRVIVYHPQDNFSGSATAGWDRTLPGTCTPRKPPHSPPGLRHLLQSLQSPRAIFKIQDSRYTHWSCTPRRGAPILNLES
jgi:hypothetical protein